MGLKMYVTRYASLWSADASDKSMVRFQEPLAEEQRLLLEESITLICCFSLVQSLLWTQSFVRRRREKNNSVRRSEMCAIMIKSWGHYSSACKDLRGYHTAEINSTTARPVAPLLPLLSAAQPPFYTGCSKPGCCTPARPRCSGWSYKGRMIKGEVGCCCAPESAAELIAAGRVECEWEGEAGVKQRPGLRMFWLCVVWPTSVSFFWFSNLCSSSH